MENAAGLEHFLGLDYGKAKIGLAVADSEIRIAFAYGTVDNDRHFLDTLGKIIEIENIDRIIIGKLGQAGGNRQSFEVADIGEKLEKAFKLAVSYQEEMFSTKMAESNLKEKGMRKIKSLDNQEAARVILQGWLDRKGGI
ncbi:MAG: Holliday junction resolvase RuvX [Candidatus Moranbacteria bacterium]|nr:Holliday junction resolvase RuvX [Candidatus Moranbacteria bacterium]